MLRCGEVGVMNRLREPTPPTDARCRGRLAAGCTGTIGTTTTTRIRASARPCG
jgi:hypothetical protein